MVLGNILPVKIGDRGLRDVADGVEVQLADAVVGVVAVLYDLPIAVIGIVAITKT